MTNPMPDLTALAAPFPAADIEWRAGSTNREKTRAMALPYITSRAVMDRLDAVCGVMGWSDDYTEGPSGGVLCGISIQGEERWVTKWDGAENTQFESVKGGLSDAFKRAAVKWGIGRYLYNIPIQWVACEQRGKSVVLTTTPQLPAWALPDTDANPPQKPAGQRRQPEEPVRIPEADQGQRQGAVSLPQALVDAGVAQNVPNAANMLNMMPAEAKLDENLALRWARAYRGSRDEGGDKKQATAIANEMLKGGTGK